MPFAGDYVDIADIAANTTYYAIKAGDEAISSTTLQDDDDLAAALAIGIWVVEADLSVTGATAGDVKVSWSTTGTMTCLDRQVQGPSASMTDANTGAVGRMQGSLAIGATPAYGTDGTQSSYVRERLVMDVDAAGTLQMRFAQNGASGTATTMKAGSSLTWHQLTAG